VEAGAWPFLVGGAICLVKSDNERDPNLLNSGADKGVRRGGSGSLGSLGASANLSVNKRYFLERLLVDNSSQRRFWAKTGL
jgi:hypothetical protein